MARKGRKKKREGRFKILNQEPVEGRTAHKTQEGTPICAEERGEDEKHEVSNERSSLALVLARSECGSCEKTGSLCVVTERRGVRTICSHCHAISSDIKTRELVEKARRVDEILGMYENKVQTITKTKPRKSARHELMGTAAQRREEQIKEFTGRIKALETARHTQEIINQEHGKEIDKLNVESTEKDTRIEKVEKKVKEVAKMTIESLMKEIVKSKEDTLTKVEQRAKGIEVGVNKGTKILMKVW